MPRRGYRSRHLLRAKSQFGNYCLLCEPSVARWMSLSNDNCNREIGVVYSTSTLANPSKGGDAKPPVRRAAARDSGVAGKSFTTPAVTTATHYAVRSLGPSKMAPLDSYCSWVAKTASGTAKEKGRQMKQANPSKGGDAKPPVYGTRVLRQRGCRMVGRTVRGSSCVASRACSALAESLVQPQSDTRSARGAHRLCHRSRTV
jgi:hypothetical protein